MPPNRSGFAQGNAPPKVLKHVLPKKIRFRLRKRWGKVRKPLDWNAKLRWPGVKVRLWGLIKRAAGMERTPTGAIRPAGIGRAAKPAGRPAKPEPARAVGAEDPWKPMPR